MRNKLNIFIPFMLVLGLSCAGGSVKFTFKNSQYPISMSPALYNSRGNIVSIGNGLTRVDSFEFKKKHWNIFWTLIPLSNTSGWLENQINETVTKNQGVGVANLSVETEHCKYSGLPIIGGIPIFPSCSVVTIRGDVVK